MKPPLKKGSLDDFQTPVTALNCLIPFLKRRWIIWECASGKGNLTNALVKEGFKVVATDILVAFDFLTRKPPRFDCVITNPPYSIKEHFLARCYELKAPLPCSCP